MLLGDSPTDPAVIDDRMVRTNKSNWIFEFSIDFSLYPPKADAYVPSWVCTSFRGRSRPPTLLCSIY